MSQIKAIGFAGGLRIVTEWATRQRKQAEQANRGGDERPSGQPPSARRIARMMTSEHEQTASARMVATIKHALPDLVAARDLLDQFHDMIQHRKSADLEDWIAEATASLLASFANGIISDRAAVQAALKEP